jgi:hypothetical protein
MDAEGMRDSHRERSHDAGNVKDDRDGDGEHKELNKPENLPGEKKKDRDDPDDPEEQRPEEGLQIRHKARAAQRNVGCRGDYVHGHHYSGCGERELQEFSRSTDGVMARASAASPLRRSTSPAS